MSAIINVTDETTGNSFTDDNTTFDVFNASSLGLTGSGNTVAVQAVDPTSGTNGDAIYHITGSNNSVVLDSSISYGEVVLNGTGNVVQAGADTWVLENSLQSGAGNTITVGADSMVDVTDGVSGDTINATAGGTRIWTGWNSVSVNADSDEIDIMVTGTAQVNGDANTINMKGGGEVLNLNGNNNTISGSSKESITMSGGNNAITFSGGNNAVRFSADNGAQTISNSSGVMLYELADGEIYWNQPATLSLKNGVATLGFTDGTNIAISDVRSSTGESNLGADSQVNQLVSAMASYSAAPGGVSSQLSAQPTTESALFASSRH